MGRPKCFLLVTWDGAGNLPPERSLARALVARGHTVHGIAHASVCETLARDGVDCVPVRGCRPYAASEPPPDDEMRFVVKHIWWARAFGPELLAAVERTRPDALPV